MVATVEGGRVVKLQGDPGHPVTRGFLCYRTSRFLERQYDPERLTSPLVRRDGRLEPASWDEALDLVASTLLRVRAESGPAAILNYRSGGSLGAAKHLTDLFFERFGPVTIKSGDICSGAGDHAQETDFGEEDSSDLFDLLAARTIVLWGKNPHVSSLHLIPVLREARARGARVVLIDPVHHRGVELADRYWQPRPGGDMALAFGMLAWLFDHDRADPDAARYCDHLDELRRLVGSRSLAEWAALADLPEASLAELAAAYADGPSAIQVGWGLQRRGNGSATVRALDALCAVSGNLGVPGGGVSFYFKRRGAFDLSFSRGLDAAPRSIPEPLLGPGILAAADPPVRAVWVSCGNPVAMLPESATVAEALRSRELTVVVDAFLTDTAREAHVVLPTTTMLEDDDLVGAYGHHWVGSLRPVVPPPEGVKTDYEILQALAPRVRLAGDEFSRPIADWKRRILGRVAAAGLTLERLETGPVRNPFAPSVLFADRRFPTATGRVNLLHRADPTPPLPTPERPLLLMAISTERAQGSQWSERARRGSLVVTVHPDAATGCAAGDRVRVESARGAIEATLRLDLRQRRDVALMPKGGWYSRGESANVLIEARATDAGGGAVYYDTPVRLVPVRAG
jgi:anaerobic selenocysteine-containing dehydrogenase